MSIRQELPYHPAAKSRSMSRASLAFGPTRAVATDRRPASSQALLLAAAMLVSCVWLPAHAASNEAGAEYRSAEQITQTLRSWGSPAIGALLERWQAEFKTHHPEIRYGAVLKGTETAQAALYTEVADLALMDREILTLERHVMVRRKQGIPLEFKVATGSDKSRDHSPALAVFVHKDNPITQLSIEQLDGVFGEQRTGVWDANFKWHASGGRGPEANIRTWSQLGIDKSWAGKEIQTYGYPVTNYSPLPGPMLSFRKVVFGGGDMWNANLLEYPNPKDSLEKLGKDRFGIAYAPLGYANANVKPVALAPRGSSNHVALTQATVASGAYPLTRSIYISVAPDKPLPPKVKEFLRFVLSDKGQALIAEEGSYLPLNASDLREQRSLLDTW